MPSDLVSQTLQGAVLSSISNIIAQYISAYKENVPFTLDPVPVLKFAIFSVVSNPPNILWQSFLEESFPNNVLASPPSSAKTNEKTTATKPETSLSKTNILIKFILDQTVGSVMNTLMFLAYMGYVNASPTAKYGPWDAVVHECREKFWPLILDGYKLWPIFSIVSFLWIPVNKRIVAGCLVGIGWGVYLSLMVDA
ncbi:hypothetical protein EJ04DRAFT_518181 [Polyplosphaeria fusca]|uniref:Uncharacterized protein n=1 Tax=Polyplosphaeria fusca TaxID=682080 RepID=A0A9P4RBH2_9PLEO|nr:hypothetical protein EJ04DRAFT_518181 [Polyplosphaeria fusca]